MPTLPIIPSSTNGDGHKEVDWPDVEDLLEIAKRAAESETEVEDETPPDYRRLADVPGINEAVLKHRGDPVNDPRSPVRLLPTGQPAPDYLADLRATARVLSFIQHDTPERQEILKTLNLPLDSLSPRFCETLARALLEELDHDQSKAERGERSLSYESLPHVSRDSPPRSPGINTRRLSDVIAREVDWLWRQRVPFGKLTILSGDPNLGKTWIALDMIARLTTGRQFPDAPNPFASATYPRRDALWVSGEDEDEDTIRPRLDLLGGDPSRVHSLSFVLDREYDKHKKRHEDAERMLDLSRHLEKLGDWLTRHPLVALVVLDPLAAFLGKIDSHRNSDVRGLLTPLTKLASKHRVAVVGINHLSKGDGENAIYRGMGSIAFVAAARSSWLVSRDPKQPKDRRLFTEVKVNLKSEEIGGLAFRVGPAWKGISWEEGVVSTTADEALKVPDKNRAPAVAEAKEWLRELLASGPVAAEDVWDKAQSDRLCEKTLKTAAKELGVRKKKTGGAGSPWEWSLKG